MKKLYIIFVVTLFISCAKFLEPKSPSEFVPKNINSLNEMLTFGAYYRGEIESVNCFTYLEMFSDDIQITTNEASFLNEYAIKEDDFHRVIAMTGDMFEDLFNHGLATTPWQHIYEHILRCTAAIDYMPNVSGTKEDKAFVEAQALFLRALSYFYLVNYFGEPYNYNKKALAVPLKLTSNLVVDMVKRNSVEEVYDQIVKDLIRAEECWKMIPDKQFKKDYRANLPATQFLLAKVYLFMENWGEAKRYAKIVMDNEEFDLYDLNSFVASASEANLDYATYDNCETIWMYGSISDYTQMSSSFFHMRKDDPTNSSEPTRNRKVFNASSSLLDSYGEVTVTGDLRKVHYIFTEWVTDAGKVGYIGTRVAVGKINNNSNMIPIGGADNLALKFRISEMYLTYAEACAMLGGEDASALTAINSIRQKRIVPELYTPIVGLTGSNLIDYIREERRRELCFEGSRWFDMRRWGMKSFKREWRKYGEVTDIYTIADNDPSFTFPIPKAVMDANSALVQNKLSSRKINE